MGVENKKFEEYREKINLFINETLNGRNTPFSKQWKYIMGPGKRVRPVLTLMVSDIFGGDEIKALNLGYAAEITHGASLAVDDIMDADDERRGAPSLHALYDFATAVVASIGYLPIALESTFMNSSDSAKELSKTWGIMSEGAIEEMMHPTNIGDKLYFDMIDKKTSRLFACAATFGGQAAGVNDSTINKLAKIGTLIGRSFQMLDDIIDIIKGNDDDTEKLDFQVLMTVIHLKSSHVEKGVKDFFEDLEGGNLDTSKAIDLFTKLMEKTDANEVKRKINETLSGAFSLIHSLNIDDDSKKLFISYINWCISSMAEEGDITWEGKKE